MPERTRERCRSERRPVRSVNVDLSSVTIWDTLTTESFGSPVSSAFNKRFPGASAHLRLLVKGTHTMVASRLWLKALHWTTSPGRRNPGSEPTGSPKSAHQISP